MALVKKKNQKQTWGSLLPHPGPFAFFIVFGPFIVISALPGKQQVACQQ
jgi:hypothetical protein